MKKRDNQATPVLLRDGEPDVFLKRVNLGPKVEGGRREDFIQELVHNHPSTIPMVDIEPAFTPLISICRELPTSAGYLDNLWMTPDGDIILGECKLFRNPQARREVVAQALDYARALYGWHYGDLEAAVRKAQGFSHATLWDAVSERADIEEAQFVDAVERRLRFGRFMILIVGDGIREGVEELTEYMQLHAGLHTSLALVDLSVWNDNTGQLIVVPRVPAKTVLIERGIVKIDNAGTVRVDAPEPSKAGFSSTTYTASEPEFYDQLEQHVPSVTNALRAFLDAVRSGGVEAEFRKSLVLRFYPSPDASASAGYIDIRGRFHAGDGWSSANSAGHVEAGDAYLEALAEIINGSIRRHNGTHPPFLMGSDGKTAKAADLLRQPDRWRKATIKLVEAVSD